MNQSDHHNDKDESILRALRESESIPHTRGDPVFTAPWQARAFGLAVAFNRLHDTHEWQDFQQYLVHEINRTESNETTDSLAEDIESSYYESWLSALEQFLIANGTMTVEELDQRTMEFNTGDRTAAEFVEGHHEH